MFKAISFIMLMFFIFGVTMLSFEQPRKQPSYYGTYYSMADALEDGFYEVGNHN